MTRRFLHIAKIVVPLVVAFFIGRMIYGNWQQIRAEPWRLDLGLLAVSFALGAAWHLVRPLGWTRLIRGFGHDLPYWDVYRVYRKSEASRYVPGGVWQFASRIYLTRRYGVGAATCLAATLLDMTLAALAALVPAAWLAGSASTSLGTWQRSALMAFPLFACTVIYPKVLNAWAPTVARILKQPYQHLEMSAGQIFSIFASYVAASTLLGFAMAVLARSLLPSIDGAQLTYMAGCYILAWVAALLTMVAPAGMGVREGILGILLAQASAVGTAMTLAVAMRLWAVCMELAWLATGQLVGRKEGLGPGP